MKFSGEKVVEIYEKIQQKRPIIHCITNAVTVNDCANILLAAGASPTMAHHPCEVEEITAGTASLICNFRPSRIMRLMKTAGKRAHALGHPIVIDPVGVSGVFLSACKMFGVDENNPSDLYPGKLFGNTGIAAQLWNGYRGGCSRGCAGGSRRNGFAGADEAVCKGKPDDSCRIRRS